MACRKKDERLVIMRKEYEKKMYRELCIWQKKGVQLLLEGRESDPGRIVRAHLLAEKGAYMRDYIPDDTGQHLKAICFNRIMKRRPDTGTAGKGERLPGHRREQYREKHINGRRHDRSGADHIMRNNDRNRTDNRSGNLPEGEDLERQGPEE